MGHRCPRNRCDEPTICERLKSSIAEKRMSGKTTYQKFWEGAPLPHYASRPADHFDLLAFQIYLRRLWHGTAFHVSDYGRLF